MHSITIDVRMYRSSGIGTYLRNILFYLLKEPFESVYLLGNPDELEAERKYPQVRIIPFTIPIYSPMEQVTFPFIIPKCDIFWSPHYNTPMLPIRTRHRIVTIHDLFHLDNPQYVPRSYRWYAKQLIASAIRKSDAIITVSNFSRDRILAHFHPTPQKIHVIYNAVDFNRFHPIMDRMQLEQTQNDLSLPQKFILYVGNVKPHKNIKGLMQAWSQICNKYSDYKLLIVGKKDQFITGISNLAEEMDHLKVLESVHFTGLVLSDKLPAIYALASCLVLPSFYEGFGLPPIEAMACGTPVIVSDIPVLRETCGEAAVYCDPNDPADIATKISHVLNDESLRANLRQKGFEQIGRFSWKTSAQKLLDVIHGIAT